MKKLLCNPAGVGRRIQFCWTINSVDAILGECEEFSLNLSTDWKLATTFVWINIHEAFDRADGQISWWHIRHVTNRCPGVHKGSVWKWLSWKSALSSTTERSFNAQQSRKNHVWNRPAGAEPTNCSCMMIVPSMTAAIPTACRRRACNSSSGSCTRNWPSQWNGTPQQIQIKTITRSRNEVACVRMPSQNARTVHPAALATDRADEAATHHQQISSKKVALERRSPKQTRGVQSDKGGVPLHRQKTRRHVTAPAWIPAIQFTYKFCLSSEAWGPQPIILHPFWSRRSTWWKLRMRWKWKCAHETQNDIQADSATRRLPRPSGENLE